MLKKDKPMLSVADIIQAQGKIWDRSFSGKCKSISKALISVTSTSKHKWKSKFW